MKSSRILKLAAQLVLKPGPLRCQVNLSQIRLYRYRDGLGNNVFRVAFRTRFSGWRFLRTEVYGGRSTTRFLSVSEIGEFVTREAAIYAAKKHKESVEETEQGRNRSALRARRTFLKIEEVTL